MKIADVGYVISADQTRPTHEPALDGPCPFCEQAVTPDTIRCVCLTPEDQVHVAQLFYYCHRACQDSASKARQDEIARDAIALFNASRPRAVVNGSGGSDG